MASQSEGAQDPEFSTTQGWLKHWNKPMSNGGMSGMGMGIQSMPGMMSDPEMKSLASASGTEFDTTFLTMMISHHEGAIKMAATEINEAKMPMRCPWQRRSKTRRQSEITAMKELLEK